ncbi:hypothetical protein [Methylomarinovum tepidoasis]|uniref:hypothetical protein n=1 Tax=Methylomarinovum tepidoasis TaxID=2840183 RepID=UPI002574177F|nr:hypothetical protein [Methylomarinovum sp. IN45]
MATAKGINGFHQFLFRDDDPIMNMTTAPVAASELIGAGIDIDGHKVTRANRTVEGTALEEGGKDGIEPVDFVRLKHGSDAVQKLVKIATMAQESTGYSMWTLHAASPSYQSGN